MNSIPLSEMFDAATLAQLAGDKIGARIDEPPSQVLPYFYQWSNAAAAGTLAGVSESVALRTDADSVFVATQWGFRAWYITAPTGAVAFTSIGRYADDYLLSQAAAAAIGSPGLRVGIESFRLSLNANGVIWMSDPMRLANFLGWEQDGPAVPRAVRGGSSVNATVYNDSASAIGWQLSMQGYRLFGVGGSN